jgi:phosphate transport system substrate-binding protein
VERFLGLWQFVLAAAAVALLVISRLPGPALRVAGATSLLPLAEAARPGLKVLAGGDVAISALGSAYGLAALLRGSADLALVDVPYRAQGIVQLEVGQATLAVIAAPGLPHHLTLAQLGGILRGDVRSWQELGGPRRRIELVLRAHGSGLRTRLRQLAGARLRPGALTALASGQVADLVQALPGGIGVVELQFAPRGLLVAIDGRLPGQAGYALRYAAYALWRQGDARGRLAADLVSDVARREGSAP